MQSAGNGGRTAFEVAALALIALGPTACGGSTGAADVADASDAVDAEVRDGAGADADGDGDGDGSCGDRSAILAVDDWGYQLQNIVPSDIGAVLFDLVVVDYSADGSDDTAFTTAEVETMRGAGAGGKIVLSYLSIGEAEDYRFYWQPDWREGDPAWLGPENPGWAGNYKVRYWDPEWQAIIFGYLDRILAAGFDGVYLDIIDAYEFWEADGRATARREMADFVAAIAARGRAAYGCRPFRVVPQNAPEVGREAGYLDVVDAIGVEDTFYNGDDRQDPDHTARITAELTSWLAAGDLVLSIDYVTLPATIEDYYTRAAAAGYVPYATARDLGALTINEGHEPD